MNAVPSRQRHRSSWRLLVGLLLVGLLLVGLTVTRSTAGVAATAPRLDGVFVQLDRQHLDWSRQRWSQELSEMASLGLDTLVVQWCREPGLSHLAPMVPPLPASTITTLLSLADELGLELYLGLYHDPAYWSRISAPAAEVRGYLHVVLEANLRVARELVPLVAEAPSFRGFYIPQEIDDQNWRRWDKRRQLARFLGTLQAELRSLVPTAEVTVSTFARGRTSPRGFAEAWAELLAAAPLDAVLFQDGFGAGGLSAPELSRYLEELGAVRGPSQLWSVVEVFRELKQRTGGFRAVSAPFARVREQLKVAEGLTDRQVGFSLRYFSTRGGVPGASELTNDYRSYLEETR